MARFERSRGGRSDSRGSRRDSGSSRTFEDHQGRGDSGRGGSRGGRGGSRGGRDSGRGFRGSRDSGRDFRGGRDGGRDRRGPIERTKVTCSDCGKECEVPFKPTSSKPVYCDECFADKGGSGKVSSQDIDEINKKLDKIMKVLEIK